LRLINDIIAIVHKSRSHRTNDSNLVSLAERKSLVRILEQHDRLGVEITSKLFGSSVVDDAVPLILGGSRIGVFEETHLELYSEDSGDGFVDNADVDGIVGDEGRNGAEVERATSHLNDLSV
jgi:hypothetical protein